MHVSGSIVISGAVVSQRCTYLFGGVREQEGESPADFGFTGQRLDDSTGLMYYRARYYAAGLGRFVQADTIVPNPGNPQSFNRYAYVLNNPLRYVDPTGNFENDAELAKYLGFVNANGAGDVQAMMSSSLWQQLSQQDGMVSLIRSKEFDFGSILMLGDAGASDPKLQLMLLRTEDNRLALWSLELRNVVSNIALTWCGRDSWALFENNDLSGGFSYSMASSSASGSDLWKVGFPSGWDQGDYGGVRITLERKNDWVSGGGKIAGGTFTAAKGATMVVAGFAGAPESLGATLLAVLPGGAMFVGGLATIGSGVKDILEVVDVNYEYVGTLQR